MGLVVPEGVRVIDGLHVTAYPVMVPVPVGAVKDIETTVALVIETLLMEGALANVNMVMAPEEVPAFP